MYFWSKQMVEKQIQPKKSPDCFLQLSYIIGFELGGYVSTHVDIFISFVDALVK
jgi:hypothetical protein